MKREIIITGDGSTTIQIPEWNEQYHSIHGAIQEANHVFIKHGLQHYNTLYCSKEADSESKNIGILEIGFGTGLNAFITLIEAQKLGLHINYTGVEAYPVSPQEIDALNYTNSLQTENSDILFNKLHSTTWEEAHKIHDDFTLTKRQQFFSKIKDVEEYNIIYFDAFGARVQPQLWTEDIFEIMFKALKPKGVLVTYSAKGSVRRAMQAVGFKVERLPGPPGKREMLRASK
ncbi:tRNA (5-methylaminomethyl-2-thiouridine)(34)-methyltransferase MnmD [Algibacter amylolyticus]|uniref:tRNA (5-methylaminomethyl-2-thiouridine)(34)-methyltransferase MnmD n=1 Tax=Algibacter amylolyticus TaxID=1608400 RepID=A0A5M7B120_9FLAO|nr:tRNA (5-methylaminomethyl-2-thiouridine)(34)-methyltransferase MnmD [Algibacter amylolyticus]KAA5823396.1 tRNA (5-methylaminomethyl-2-thiouridine)(34)-methyltransferase MnmD [Algibacter amylolyticus]MBB5267545.1 tRNA U34 5-methylaminomethyl-2-thiouridine-forming methyltransferase MnmC [Algibacter amylolyticus]TSJ73884.1 tRNA (5-methylaminomethyl-2-thiouridine)(34)-methyltransferase MnmD [Algibacter amylolyticus]